MRKSALIAVFCLGLLTGCGKMDPVENSQETVTTVHSEAETNNSSTAKAADPTTVERVTETSAETTENTEVSANTTTATTNGGSLVRRTTVPVSKPTGNVPVQSSTKRTGNAPVQSTSTTTTTTTAEIDTDPYVFSSDELSCKVTKDGIDVTIDGEETQTIEIDTEELRNFIENETPDKKGKIIIDDIDLDGHPDLFIPQQIALLNTFGVYYHYDADQHKFVIWEEFEDIDSCAAVDKEEKTFTTDVKLSEDEYEIRIFGWEDSKPVLRSMTRQYRNSENDLIIDTFDYTNGEEYLIKRERVLFDNDGEIAGAEVLELE